MISIIFRPDEMEGGLHPIKVTPNSPATHLSKVGAGALVEPDQKGSIQEGGDSVEIDFAVNYIRNRKRQIKF